MNKLRQLSRHAIRRASSLGKLTAIEEKNLALSSGGSGVYTGDGKSSVTIGPADATCPHVEYPASA